MAELNYQVLNKGFGSYLQNILPDDIATAAGAFAFSLRQVRNIENAKIEKFAQSVFSLETVTNLPLVNGTSVPTDQTLQNQGMTKMALGSGPYGTYTYSDFFGCMSGLPFPLKEFSNLIQNFASIDSDLYDIYTQLYLAVSWETATAIADVTDINPSGPPLYQVDSITLTDGGGGYYRGNADESTITITLSNGGTGRVVPVTGLGKDPNNVGSNGTGEYGRILAIELLTPGSNSGTIPTVTISNPPDDSTGGWPGMNTVVQTYIDAANALISGYSTQDKAKVLNEIYKAMGQQLRQEQRSRYIGIPPVDVPTNFRVNPYPSTQQNFVDSIPTYAVDTLPHMASQTIENISDLSTVGGQSIVALLRASRNQAVLAETGITLDDNIEDTLPLNTQKQLILNGTSLTGTPNTGIQPTGIQPSGLFPTPIPAGLRINTYTMPSYPVNQIDNVELTICNNMLFDNCTNDELVPQGNQVLGTIETLISNDTCIPAVNTLVTTGPYINPYNTPNSAPQAGSLISTLPAYPGSLASTAPILPITLDAAYNSGTLLCSKLTVDEAIDKVIECNCDCWDI